MQFEHLEKEIFVNTLNKTDLSYSSKKEDLSTTGSEMLNLFTPETLVEILKIRKVKKH